MLLNIYATKNVNTTFKKLTIIWMRIKESRQENAESHTWKSGHYYIFNLLLLSMEIEFGKILSHFLVFIMINNQPIHLKSGVLFSFLFFATQFTFKYRIHLFCFCSSFPHNPARAS